MNEGLAVFFAYYLIPTVRPFVVTVFVLGLWVALGRAGISRQVRTAVVFGAALVLAAWLSTMWTLTSRGFFLPAEGVPVMPFAIFLPLAVGLFGLLGSRFVGRVLDAADPAWLVRLQSYRMLGLAFLMLWSIGAIPGVFAFPAGIGDFLTGLFALPAAAALASGSPGARSTAIAWNLFGIADLVIAIMLGMLTTPGPLHLLALSQPNVAILTYPTALVPAFTVPFSLILHGLSLRQLLRRRADRPFAAAA